MSRLQKLKQKKEELKENLENADKRWKKTHIKNHLERVTAQIKRHGEGEAGPELLQQRF